MGGGMSIEQNNLQSTSTSALESSQEFCSIATYNLSDVNITANNSTLNNVRAGQVVSSNSSSCALKSTLQTSIINNLKSQQGATQVDIPGIFTFLGDLTGSSDSINQNNSQVISNQSSQLMNSMCQDNKTNAVSVSLVVNNTTVNNLDLSNYVRNQKFNCVIANMSSFLAQNDESNSQKATQVRIDGLVFVILIIVAGVIGVAALKYGFKSSSKTNPDGSLEKTLELSALGPRASTLPSKKIPLSKTTSF